MEKKVAQVIICALLVVPALTGCMHEHTFADATCTSAKTCTECGETEGETLGHNWIPADCINPEKCTICGKESNPARGHETNLGKCDRCGEIQNESIINRITSASSSAGDDVTTASNLILSSDYSSLNDIYNNIIAAQSYLNDFEMQMDTIINACYDDRLNGDTESELASQCENILSYLPNSISGSSSSEIMAYLNEFKTFLNETSNYFEYMSLWITRFSY